MIMSHEPSAFWMPRKDPYFLENLRDIVAPVGWALSTRLPSQKRPVLELLRNHGHGIVVSLIEGHNVGTSSYNCQNPNGNQNNDQVPHFKST